TTLPPQSISVTFFRFLLSQGSRSASLVVPAETIFPATQRTAPSLMMLSSLRAGPRRGPVEPERMVRSWPILARSRGESSFALIFRSGTGGSLAVGESIMVKHVGQPARLSGRAKLDFGAQWPLRPASPGWTAEAAVP